MPPFNNQVIFRTVTTYVTASRDTAAPVSGHSPKKEEEGPSLPIRLTYFDANGRAEMIRLVLAAGSVDFEDRRIGFPEWKELKPSERKEGAPEKKEKGLFFGGGVIVHACF